MPLECIPVAYREPFDFSHCYVDQRPCGESILEIVRSVPKLPGNFMQCGYVCINGEIVPRELWSYVRPKPPRPELHVAVTLHVSLGSPGGGRSTGKTIGALVAALALVVITAGISAGALPAIFGAEALGGYFVAGSLSAQLLAGAVGLAGALAISALTAPPTAAAGVDLQQTNQEQAEAAAASGNILDRGGAVPRVIGTRKIFPPLACEPVVELVDQDEVVEALFVLNGPHALTDIRIEGTPIVGADDLEFETREGWPGDTAVGLITRQGRTTTPQIELSTLSQKSNGLDLQHQSLPESDLPVWHVVASRSAPDQIWIHLLFPGGIFITSANAGAVPLRIRFRKKGNVTWINMPEIHLAGNSTNQLRAAILFKWAAADPLPEPPTPTGFYYGRLNPPNQTVSPATPLSREWHADAYFDSGGGNDYVFNGNAASTSIRNIALYDNRCEIFLDNTFARGIYEIQIKRGYLYFVANFNTTTYS